MEQSKGKPEEKGHVVIFHTGKGYGPMHTDHGMLSPGASLKVSEECAAKLVRAYPHIKYAKDVLPGVTIDPKAAEENIKLKAEVKRLEGELEKSAATIKEAMEKIASLESGKGDEEEKGRKGKAK
jgi:hypothetical protein